MGVIECGHLRPVKCNIIIHLNKDDKMKDVSSPIIKSRGPSTLRIVSVILGVLVTTYPFNIFSSSCL